MNLSQAYIAISVVALAAIAVAFFIPGKIKPEKRLSNLASLSFVFIIAGFFFGENNIWGYGLMGVGIIVAIIDIIKKSNK